MKILVCNSGSSSLKFSLFEAEQELLLAEGSIDWTTRPTRLVFRRPGQPEIREELHLREHSEAAGRILADLQAGPSAPLQGIQDIDAVGHRVVHGGGRFTAAVRITPEVQSAIGELSELAPLHNPASLRGHFGHRASSALGPAGGGIRHGFPHHPARGSANLRPPADLEDGVGNSPLRISWLEPCLLRQAGG